MDRTPKEMRDDSNDWSRAQYPAVAIGRYRDAADQIERLQKRVAELEHILMPSHDKITVGVARTMSRFFESWALRLERERSP